MTRKELIVRLFPDEKQPEVLASLFEDTDNPSFLWEYIEALEDIARKWFTLERIEAMREYMTAASECVRAQAAGEPQQWHWFGPKKEEHAPIKCRIDVKDGVVTGGKCDE